MHEHILMSALNLVLSMGVIGAAICRLAATTRRTRPVIRAQFTLLVVGGSANALQSLILPTPAGIGNVVMSAALLLFLLLSSHRWADGAPPDTVSPPLEKAKA